MHWWEKRHPVTCKCGGKGWYYAMQPVSVTAAGPFANVPDTAPDRRMVVKCDAKHG